MIAVQKRGIILSKSAREFEREGVLNPAIIKVGEVIHMFYRAVAEGNFSSIGYCTLSSPLEVATRSESPLLCPEFDYESHGIEDPRIVLIEDLYYLTYTAYDGTNALGALATSKDMVVWEKHGIIVPKITYQEFRDLLEKEGAIREKYVRYNEHEKSHEKQDRKIFLWDKNVIFFPRKINNKLCFLHRIKPDIQIVVDIEKLEDLTIDFWRDYFLHFDTHIVLAAKYQHEVSYVGSGCPPIETEAGWLIIYHGVYDTVSGYVYSGCAALLDLEHPEIEIARLPYPLFFPEEEWELKGEVNNVCFPTGTVLDNDTLYIYYGAADERIAVVSVSMSELLAELAQNTI